MSQPAPDSPPRRGRPPKARLGQVATREALLRSGVALLTEKGFTTAGLEEILKREGVPKGSFYHYFPSKEAFGLALIDHYGDYFARKLARHLDIAPGEAALPGLQAFMADARAGMIRHGFRRGCLAGNLSQEMPALPEAFRERLLGVFTHWETRVAQVLEQARAQGEIPPASDCQALAESFWIGWEGAVSRARLARSPGPLDRFAAFFLTALGQHPPRP